MWKCAPLLLLVASVLVESVASMFALLHDVGHLAGCCGVRKTCPWCNGTGPTGGYSSSGTGPTSTSTANQAPNEAHALGKKKNHARHRHQPGYNSYTNGGAHLRDRDGNDLIRQFPDIAHRHAADEPAGGFAAGPHTHAFLSLPVPKQAGK